MENLHGYLEFSTFYIELTDNDESPIRKFNAFKINKKSPALGQIKSGNFGKIVSLRSRETQRSSKISTLESDFEKEASELVRVRHELEEVDARITTLNEDRSTLNRKFSDLKSELDEIFSALDPAGEMLDFFGGNIENLAWQTGINRDQISRILTKEGLVVEPKFLIQRLTALEEFVKTRWDEGELGLAFESFWLEDGHKFSKNPEEILGEQLSEFEERVKERQASVREREQASKKQSEQIEEEIRLCDLTIQEFEQKRNSLLNLRAELESVVTADFLLELQKAGIHPIPGFSARQVVEEILQRTMEEPFVVDEFDSISLIFGNPMSPILFRALISKKINNFFDKETTCCWSPIDKCDCDPIASARTEVENRLNLNWREWVDLLRSRGQYCWPYVLKDTTELLKLLSKHFTINMLLSHFLECMLIPDWATKIDVVRKRIYMPRQLSEADARALNMYLLQNFGFSRSDAVENLLANHSAFRYKAPEDVMAWLSMLITIEGIDDAGRQLAEVSGLESR